MRTTGAERHRLRHSAERYDESEYFRAHYGSKFDVCCYIGLRVKTTLGNSITFKGDDEGKKR